MRDRLRDGWLALLTASHHRRELSPSVSRGEQYPKPQAEHQNQASQGSKRYPKT